MNKTIHELNSLAQAQADDEFIIYDVSEGESKKIQVQSLNNPNYSTTEQKTGGTWIDGKPIYRKVIDFGALPNATDKTVAHNISNIDKILSISGWTSNASQTNPLPFTNPADTIYQIMMTATTTNVMVRTGTDRREYTTTYITLEYTKTTD